MTSSARVFVSGGAGVIGRELVHRLVQAGASVLVGDIKPRPDEFDPAVIYRQGDLNYLARRDLEWFQPDSFVHLAASFERTRETYEFWDENYWNNVRLSHHLMTLIKDCPTMRRVIFASSYLIYDSGQYQFDEPRLEPVSLDESRAILPRNLTGMAKLAHEMELSFLASFNEVSFSTICARIFRGYGKGSRDVISRWVRMLIAGETIEVYGADSYFDYIYAEDTAQGLIRLLEAESVSGVVNLGSGRARRVRDVVNVLQSHFPDMRLVERPCAVSYEASQADITVFQKATGWEPEYDLEDAIPLLIGHERKTMDCAAETVSGNVLVSSASGKVPMVRAVQAGARKIGGDIQVFAGDVNPRALSRFVADGFWELPRIPGTEDIDALVAGCQERGITTIFPTRDQELPFWAQHRERFAEYRINVVVSPADSIRICLDKLAFSQWGAPHGLGFIPTVADPEALDDREAYVVKERYGAGSRKIGLNLSRVEAIRKGRECDTPIYQPFIRGREISIDAWLSADCQVKGLVCRWRDQVENGESRITSSFRDARVESHAEEVLNALKLRGPIVLQFLMDDCGDIHVVECNARFGGASTASVMAGLDSFYWSLLESRAIRIDEYPFSRIPDEVRQIRLSEDLYIYGDHF